MFRSGSKGNGNMSPEKAFERELDRLSMEDTIRMFNSMVERCFFNCVNEFSTSSLTNAEELCVFRCAEKYLRHQSRVSRVFAEQHVLSQQQQQQPQGGLSISPSSSSASAPPFSIPKN